MAAREFRRPPFADRVDAGEALAGRLTHTAERGAIVLGLPRGGVVVAATVAERLGAPLDVLIVAKVGLPGHEELAVGAVGEGGVVVWNEPVIERYRVRSDALERAVQAAQAKVAARQAEIRAEVQRIDIEGRAVIIVDDGLATGATARAAIDVARAQGATHVTLAVPVAPADVVPVFDRLADEFVTVLAPRDFQAVGLWYADFSQTTTEEVIKLLKAARSR